MIVIGDKIIDEYLVGTSSRLSPEAPVPVIKDIKKSERTGGAANVWMNLQALGEDPVFVYNPNQTTRKTRIITNDHIVCRLDDEKYTAWQPKFNFDLFDHEYAILSDYGKGVLHYSKSIIEELNRHDIKCLVDPKRPFKCYENAWLIKANQKEFEAEVEEDFSLASAPFLCNSLCDDFGFKYVIVTLGSKGCFVYDYEGKVGHMIPANSRTVIDVTGAGDVFMAALAHFVQTDSVHEAAKKANTLAGISVEHMGTYVLTPDDIAMVKPKIVFTNGCFDILHPGHIQLLNESKKLGNKLIVGLNSDASVKRLKGKDRPILSQNRRKKMLEALGIVDEIIIFDEDTPLELIKAVKPNIITKGGDYKEETVVGHELAEVVIIPTVEGYSTTGVINAIKR